MRIRLMLALSALAALLLTALPAQAIVGGVADDGAHPYVAAISNGSTVCSGTAISPTVLVTAAHCFAFPSEPVRVIFDESYRSPTRTLRPGTWFAHPQFCPTCAAETKAALADLAVVVLAEPVTLPRYAQLPAPGLVDRLPRRATVELVGYGAQAVARVKGDPSVAPPSGLRMRATAELLNASDAVADELLKVSAQLSQGRGAACFGDSGGPILLGDTILGVVSFGAGDVCRVATYAYRLDTPLAQAFVTAPR